MSGVCHVAGRAFPLGRSNVDTDLIIPASHLKTTSRAGLGLHAFEAIRAEPDNVFDDPRFAGAPILIAGSNFGCGSSREHAVWAMRDFGIQAVIAPSYSDIFAGNAFKNGLLAVVLPTAAVERILQVAQDHPITIDLSLGTVSTPLQDHFPFEMDAFRRECLMQGLDEIALTLAHEAMICAHELGQPLVRPRHL